MKISIYKDVFANTGHKIELADALARIKNGKSKDRIIELRSCKDQLQADEIKKKLPAVTFSGIFYPTRSDGNQIEKSGFIVLDFDKLDNLQDKKVELSKWEHCYAVWISPSGNGLKVLVRVSEPDKHRDHFKAIQERWPLVDRTGVNPSRLCFESYDPDIYLNESAKVFTELFQSPHQQAVNNLSSEDSHFQKIVTWLASRGDGFRTGERNSYIYKLASACCRLGLEQGYVLSMCRGYATGTFSIKECDKAVESGYKGNVFGSAEFKNERVNDRVTKKEIVLDNLSSEEEEMMQRDIVHLNDVESNVDDSYYNGLGAILGIGVPEIDNLFKMNRTELTVITGYANHGKSAFAKWYYMMRALKYGEKVAIFDPEETPEKFFRDMIGIYCGQYIPKAHGRLSVPNYEKAKRFIGNHFLYIDSKVVSPTPTYVKSLFLRTIMLHGVSTVVIDPFNQLANNYAGVGGRSDKYLETFLADIKTFAKTNNIHVHIVAHPKSPHPSTKDASGNFPIPTMYDIADGAMWGNKSDNILVYYRPFSKEENSECTFTTRKIKDQESVGKIGEINLRYNYVRKRFFIERNGTLVDPIQEVLDGQNKQVDIEFSIPLPTALTPNSDFLTNAFGQPRSDDPSDEYQDLF